MTVGARFDTVVHAPLRLQICAMLAAVESAEFSTVRDALEVSDSVLSKHVKVLDGAGYLRLRKAVVASRQRTWLALTADGRSALAGHVAELHRLLDTATDAAPKDRTSRT